MGFTTAIYGPPINSPSASIYADAIDNNERNEPTSGSLLSPGAYHFPLCSFFSALHLNLSLSLSEDNKFEYKSTIIPR